MRLKRFADVNEFYPHVEPYLLAREAEHNLMLGLCATLMKTDTYQESPYLAYVEDGGEAVAVAMRTPPFNLVVSEVASASALALVAQDVGDVYHPLVGVSGPKRESKSFANVWQQINGVGHQLSRATRIYRLEHVQPGHAVSHMRPAVEADREILIEWWGIFFAEALDGVSREEARRSVDMRLYSDPSIRGLRVWCDEGRPDSQRDSHRAGLHATSIL